MRIRTFHRSFHSIFIISFVLCVLTVVNAQPELDITFNSSGTASANFFGAGDTGYGAVVQPDNKIVVAGIYTNNTGILNTGVSSAESKKVKAGPFTTAAIN
ncbi:MAG TPA: hypothetical protein VGO50_11950 [Pyrinomonadaceae bacterium]|jgi:hypothetical protein|nr:hypothetical protein [Pyrinomonadaceae bacterium]